MVVFAALFGLQTVSWITIRVVKKFSSLVQCESSSKNAEIAAKNLIMLKSIKQLSKFYLLRSPQQPRLQKAQWKSSATICYSKPYWRNEVRASTEIWKFQSNFMSTYFSSGTATSNNAILADSLASGRSDISYQENLCQTCHSYSDILYLRIAFAKIWKIAHFIMKSQFFSFCDMQIFLHSTAIEVWVWYQYGTMSEV